MKNVVAILACLSLGGCASPWYIGKIENGAPLSFGSSKTVVTQVDKDALIAGQSLTAPKARELADQLLNQSDINCQNYLTGASWENNALAVALDFTSLTLSTVSPITKPARSAGILSAGAAVSTGTKQVLTSDILGGKDFGLIHDAVVDGRAAERKLIQADIDKGVFDAWTPKSILSHMQPYHYDCGLEFGLKYLRETLANQASKPSTATPSDTAKAADTASKAVAAKATAAAGADAKAQAAAKLAADTATASDSAATAAEAGHAPNAKDLRAKATDDAAKAKAAADLAAKAAKADQSAKTAATAAADAATKADAASDADAVSKAAAATADADAKTASPAPAAKAGASPTTP